MTSQPQLPEPEQEEHCWCGGTVFIDENGEKRCSNADPNEVGP